MTAILFDAYGTLLDTDSGARRHAARIGPDWQAFSILFRAKQLEHTWVRSLAGRHRDFAHVTDDALAHAAAVHGLTDVALLAELRDSFDHLDAFTDVAPALHELRAHGRRLAVLSNGTPSMLAHQLRHAGIEDLFEAVISVEELGIYKPSPRVYRLAVDRLGVAPERTGFVSSNPWDVFGANAFGLRAVWVNRRELPREYGLDVPMLPDFSGLSATL